MGRKKIFDTPKAFDKAVEKYFKSICTKVPVIRKEVDYRENDDGTISYEVDGWGHPKMRWVRVLAEDKRPAMREEWIAPPTISGLCLYLGIHRDTWSEYAKREGYSDTVMRARGRIETYLQERLEDKSAARGAAFCLEHNFGWKHKQEVSMDEKTQKTICAAGMTMDEKLALLQALGLELPKEETE